MMTSRRHSTSRPPQTGGGSPLEAAGGPATTVRVGDCGYARTGRGRDLQQVWGVLACSPFHLTDFAPTSSVSASGNGGKGPPSLPLGGHAKGRPLDDRGVHRAYHQRVRLFLDLPLGGGGATTMAAAAAAAAVGAALAVNRLSSTRRYFSRYRREHLSTPTTRSSCGTRWPVIAPKGCTVGCTSSSLATTR